MANSLNKDLWKLAIQIPFPSKKQAIVACNSLRIDKEPRKSEISRDLIVEENILKM